MTQKDLAEEYADLQYKIQQDAPEESPDLSKGVFGHEDIVNAFNAGRESVADDIPDLKWENVFEDGAHIAASSFGVSYKVEFAYNEFNLFCNYSFISCHISLSAAKQAANEDYKQRIKQALGL
jgi:hypothetical protein